MADAAAERKILVKNVIEDIKLTERLYGEDRICEAYLLQQNIENFAATMDLEHRQKVGKRINSSPCWENLRVEGQQQNILVDLINDNECWNIWKSGIGVHEDVTVSIHKDEIKGQYFFKIEGRIHCDMKHALVALMENEMFKLWMPLCTNSQVLVKPQTLAKRIVNLDFDFALVQKQAIVRASGDVLQDGGILMNFCSLNEQEMQDYRIPETLESIKAAGGSGGFNTPYTPSGLSTVGEAIDEDDDDDYDESKARAATRALTGSIAASSAPSQDEEEEKESNADIHGDEAEHKENGHGGVAASFPNKPPPPPPPPPKNLRQLFRSNNSMVDGQIKEDVDDSNDEKKKPTSIRMPANARKPSGGVTFGEPQIVGQGAQGAMSEEDANMSAAEAALAVTGPPVMDLYGGFLFYEELPSNSNSAIGKPKKSFNLYSMDERMQELQDSIDLRDKSTDAEENTLGAAAQDDVDDRRKSISLTASPAASTPGQLGSSLVSLLSAPVHQGFGQYYAQEQEQKLLHQHQQHNVVHVRGVFKIDLKFGFIPDWIFNMAVRSSISMMLPMLEHQAVLFRDDKVYQQKLKQNQSLLAEVDTRIKENRERQKSQLL